MGSQSQNLRSCESDFENWNGDDIIVSAESPSSLVLSDDRDDGKIDDLDPDRFLIDVSLLSPPLPPRLRQHELQPRFAIQTLDFEDDPPPVPVRAPILNRHPLPPAAGRPIIEPRCKAEAQLAGVHGLPRSLLSRSKPVLPGLLSSEVSRSTPWVISRTIQSTPKPQLHSRIILDRGRPTTVIEEGSFETESVRTSFEQPVVQLSLWSARSPASNLRLGAIVNPQKCSNEYVEGPTLGPVVTSQRDHELTSFTQHGPRLSLESESLHATDQGEAKSVGRKKLDFFSKRDCVCRDRIVCSRCGRCRCRKCAEQQELPRRWVGKRECSVESAVDCCTCMCCARAVFYHCVPTEDADCSDDPCAGRDRPRCFARWAALGLLSVCLPCLCFYWPMRCLVRACTSCYNDCCRAHGCRCQHDVPLGEKSLLTVSESSSF